MDLSKELHPIGFYVNNRREMVGHMFASLKKQKLFSMLPDILKVRSVAQGEWLLCFLVANMPRIVVFQYIFNHYFMSSKYYYRGGSNV